MVFYTIFIPLGGLVPNDGYDDVETVAEMDFQDLILIPNMKRGHAKRTLKEINVMVMPHGGCHRQKSL